MKLSYFLLFLPFAISTCLTAQTTGSKYDATPAANTKPEPKAPYETLAESPASFSTLHASSLPYAKSTTAAKTSTSANCQCLMEIDPTFSIVPFANCSPPLYRNDDSSSAAIALDFNFCFYGTTYTSCFINNNGNITFNRKLPAYSPGGFPAGNASSLDTIMIAPFWGDVDTRNPSSGLVYYKKTPTALIVKWNYVGYFSYRVDGIDKLNDFQLIITDGTDPILPSGNNIAFCYGDMQWTSGQAGFSANGLNGWPATVGVNKGDRANYIQLGRFNRAGLSYDGPYGGFDGISFLDDKSYFFNTCSSSDNLPPIVQDATGGSSLCGDTIRMCGLSDTLVYSTDFLAPESSQTIAVTASAPTLGNSFQLLNKTVSAGGLTNCLWRVVASPTLAGVHTVVITGADNGIPTLSTSATYYIKIANTPILQPVILVAPTSASICANPGATLTLNNCFSYDRVYWSNGAITCSTVVNSSGVYYVTIKQAGCYKSTADSIVIVPNPVPVISGSLTYCYPANNTILSVNPPFTGMSAYLSYTWSPPSINTSTAVLTFGTKTLTVTDANGCEGSRVFAIDPTSVPTLNFNAPDLSICPKECVKVKALGASSYTPGNYSWSNNAANTSDSASFCTAGTYTTTYTDAKGCVVTQSLMVMADAEPMASFISTPPSPVFPEQPVDFISTSTISAGSITSSVWHFGDGAGGNGNTITHGFLNAGTFSVTLIVTGSNGCQGSVSTVYQVESVLVIPNVMTPNGDRANDFLKFKNLHLFPSNHLTIFNRWGKKIFEQDNYKNDWDGSGYSDGAYFFVLSVPDADPKSYQGYFQIIH